MAEKKQKGKRQKGCAQQTATKERLTAEQLKLLETLLDPNNRFKTITEACSIAGVDRTTYYRAFNNHLFKARYEEGSKGLAFKHVGPVMNAFVREATRGSYTHGIAILEMAGVYTKKERKEISGPDGAPIPVGVSPLSDLSEEELKELIRRAAATLAP